MPVRLFWSMCGAVERLHAMSELSLFDVMSVAEADPGTRNEFRESLRERIGTVTRTPKPVSKPDEILALIREV
jgi:hypothetical protein